MPSINTVDMGINTIVLPENSCTSLLPQLRHWHPGPHRWPALKHLHCFVLHLDFLQLHPFSKMLTLSFMERMFLAESQLGTNLSPLCV